MRRVLPRLVTCLVFIPMFPILADEAVLILEDGWEYRWEGSTAEWREIDPPVSPLRSSSQDVLWERVPLPRNLRAGDALYLNNPFLSFDLYLGDQPIYRYREPDGVPVTPWHLVKLPATEAGSYLSLRVTSPYFLIGVHDAPWVGTPEAIIRRMILQDIDRLVVVALCVALGVIVAPLVAPPVRRGEFGYLALFAFSLGMYVLRYTRVKQLLTGPTVAWNYLWIGALLVMPVAFLGFIRRIHMPGHNRVTTFLLRLHLLVAPPTLFFAVSDPFGAGQVSLLIVRLLYLVSMVWVIYLTIDRLRSGDSDSRVLVVGLLILVLTGFHDILLAYGLVADGRPILHFGMLSLVASLTTIAGARIVRAFGAVERQAHAIRRMSEERLRMADELHDGLGSVMTNIGLLSDIGARRPERATASLATVSDLARRGLEEIRSFMRALDGHKPRWRDLLAEYRLFGQSTLENLGIQFVLRDSIEIPHETLPEHLYVLLSRTFREVVTNAIKHSGADRIQVTLVAEGSKVRLEVRDNGTGRPGGNQLEGAYTGGHGLGALLRRVQNAGGELSIVRASGWIVSVNLPIEAGAQTIPDNGDSVRIDATR